MAANNSYSKITPDIERLANKCSENTIATDLYTEYDVKRGLRQWGGCCRINFNFVSPPYYSYHWG